MRKQVATAAKTYGRAKTVAVLWIISMILPVTMFPVRKWQFSPINFGAIVVFLAVLFFLTRFVRKRVSEQSWARSETVVYVIVPLVFFSLYFGLMLSPLAH